VHHRANGAPTGESVQAAGCTPNASLGAHPQSTIRKPYKKQRGDGEKTFSTEQARHCFYRVFPVLK
jgi:hypothetical protein